MSRPDLGIMLQSSCYFRRWRLLIFDLTPYRLDVNKPQTSECDFSYRTKDSADIARFEEDYDKNVDSELVYDAKPTAHLQMFNV